MKLLIIFILFFPFDKVFAEFYTGNDLLNRMQSQNNMDKIQALGYVQGVFDVHVDVTVCPSGNVTAGQVHDVIQNYLITNPSIRHRTAESLANEAMKKVWPCQQQPRRGA